jgi:putative transposase
LKRKSPRRGDIWHLDEAVISINGEKRYLWRVVDQEGYVLDEIVQIHRDTKAARRLLTRLLRKQGRPPKRIITDKLGSYAAAKREVMPNVEHRSHKGLNNRAENSHVPIRKRERMMQGFRSWSALQRFVSTFSVVRNHFVPPRSQRSALSTHLHRLRAMAEWKSVSAAAA